MRHLTWATIGLLALPLAAGAGEARAAPQAPPPAAESEEDEAERTARFEAGWRSYQRYCQTCHGPWGRGDGPVARWLKVPPTDLTRLSEDNEGVFPAERLARVIDGREEVQVHGRRDMPIWGEVLGGEAEGAEAEEAVDERIAELLEALRSLDRRDEAPGEPPG